MYETMSPSQIPNPSIIEFNDEWHGMKANGVYSGEVGLNLPKKGVSSGLFAYPKGRYQVVSSEHWALGITRRPFEIGYCRFGSASCEHRDVMASELVISEPGAKFEAELVSRAQIHYVLISADRFNATLADMATIPNQLGRERPVFFSSALMAQLVHSILLCSQDPDWANEHYSDAMTDALILEIAQYLWSFAEKGREDLCSADHQSVSFVKQYISERMNQRLSVAELAETAGLGERAFCVVFKAATGLTPHQYIMDLRITRAQEMLSTSNLSAAQIAFDCGFSSQSHLTDVFRKRVGTTPKQLRHRG